MCGEATSGPAASSRPHHPQRPLRRRPAGGGCHLRLGREGSSAEMSVATLEQRWANVPTGGLKWVEAGKDGWCVFGKPTSLEERSVMQ